MTDIGVEHFFIEDGFRSAAASYSSRTIPISVLFPARACPDSTRVRYADLYRPAVASAFDHLLWDLSLSHVDREAIIEKSTKIETGCYESARVLATEEPYPLLIYSPAGDGNRFSNLPVLNRIVRSGYVVISIDHPHEGILVVYPDGHLCVEPAENDDFIHLSKERVRDAQKVLDFAQSAELPKDLADRLDFHSIGTFGHSRGGYVSTLLDAEDKRIKAVANLDGFLYAYWTNDGTTGINRWPEETQAKLRASRSPFLRVLGRPHSEGSASVFEKESRDFNGDFNSVIFEGWKHQDFSTSRWHLNRAHLANTKTIFSFQPAKRVVELSAVITEFFDIYLKRKDCRRLLAAENGPRVLFRNKRGDQGR